MFIQIFYITLENEIMNDMKYAINTKIMFLDIEQCI